MKSPLYDQRRVGGMIPAPGVSPDRGGSGDHGRHPAALRRDGHAGHVRLVRGERILHRPGHGGDGRLVEDAGRAGEGLHRETGDAPLNELHPGVVEEVLDLRLADPVARLSMMVTSWS